MNGCNEVRKSEHWGCATHPPWGHKCSMRCDDQWPSAGRTPEHPGSVTAEGSGGVRPVIFRSAVPDRQTTRVCSRSRDHQGSVAKKARPSKTHQNPMTTTSKSIKIQQNPSHVQAIRIDQNQSIKVDQNQLKSFKIDQNLSESNRIYQNRSKSIKIDQKSIKINQNQSKSIKID